MTGEGDMETRKRDSLLVKQAVMKQSSPRIGGQDENDDGYIPRRINDDDDNDSNSAISGISNYDRNGRTVSRDSHITAASMPRAPPLLRPNPPPRPLPPVGAKGGLFDESNSKISNMINVGVKMDQDRADSHDDDDTNEDYWENS